MLTMERCILWARFLLQHKGSGACVIQTITTFQVEPFPCTLTVSTMPVSVEICQQPSIWCFAHFTLLLFKTCRSSACFGKHSLEQLRNWVMERLTSPLMWLIITTLPRTKKTNLQLMHPNWVERRIYIHRKQIITRTTGSSAWIYLIFYHVLY